MKAKKNIKLVIRYKGQRIFYNISTKKYLISYYASSKVWRKDFKSERACKIKITKAHNYLRDHFNAN